MNIKTILILIFIFIILASTILFILVSKRGKNGENIIPVPISIPSPTKAVPTPFKEIPQKLGPTLDQGITSASPSAIESEKEIQKISALLPFKKTYSLSTGITVEVVISKLLPRYSKWILPISMSGIDFQVPEGNPTYNLNKESFLETADLIFAFLNENNVDVSKVYIDWGGRKFIQDRAEKWLSEK